jgi:hypothetical protein
MPSSVLGSDTVLTAARRKISTRLLTTHKRGVYNGSTNTEEPMQTEAAARPIIEDIAELLTQASNLADVASQEAGEKLASDPYATLAQQIDFALARAEQITA